jgi:hypothetical protein
MGSASEVAAEQDRRARPLTLEDGHDRADGPPEVHLHRQVRQRRDHGVAGGGEVEPELGAAVQRATQRYRPWLHAAGLGVQSFDRGGLSRHVHDPDTSRR